MEGKLIIEAILDFFRIGKLLYEVNNTIIALGLKNANPNSLSDFRSISYRNTIHKCIDKIIANHIAYVLPFVVGKKQLAFVPKSHILDNILLVHKLVHAYHSCKSPLRYSIKIDLMKTFDSVE